MNNEVGVHESVKAEISGFEMKPRSLDEAMKVCEIMANSDLVPKDYKNKPGNIMVAIQMGSELGMSPMRSLRSIAVINGRASQWGDDMLAMVQASPICEYVYEHESTDAKGVCRVKRKNEAQEHISTFSLEDAKRAGLLGKQGSWQTNTARMLKLRARGFALRDKFADVLAGLITVEEAMDLPPVEAQAGEATILPMNQPLTLKDKLKAKVEAVERPAPASVTEPTTAGGYDSPKDALSQAGRTGDPPPAHTDSAVTAQDYISKAKLSQSVRECSEVGNQAEADESLTAGELKSVRAVVSARLKELGGKK